MAENFDGPIAVIPTEGRYRDVTLDVEARGNIEQFPQRVFRFLRPLNTSSTGQRIIKVLTEADIAPDSFGPTRLYRGGSPVGTANSPNNPGEIDLVGGQVIVHLDWAHSGEQISDGKEAYAAFFPDDFAERTIEGACFDDANSDRIEIPFDWGNLNASWEINMELTVDDITADRPILTAFNNTGTPDDNFIAFRTSGDLEAYFGDGVVEGTNGVTFDVATYPTVADFYDGTRHVFRLTFDGVDTFELFLDGTSLGTETASNPSFEVQSPIDLGAWIKTGTDAHLSGKIRNFRILVGGSTEVFLPLNEKGSTTTVADKSGFDRNGTLVSGDASAVWASNITDGHSGWSFISAECEDQIFTIAEP